jgi:hypothetical protein
MKKKINGIMMLLMLVMSITSMSLEDRYQRVMKEKNMG